MVAWCLATSAQTERPEDLRGNEVAVGGGWMGRWACPELVEGWMGCLLCYHFSQLGLKPLLISF